MLACWFSLLACWLFLVGLLIFPCWPVVFLLVGWHVVLGVRSCNSVPDNASEIDGFLRAHCPRAAACAHTVACAVLQRASEPRPVERCDGATADVLFTFAVQKSTPPLHHSTAQRRKRSPPQAHRDVPRPRHCRARARCAAPCTRAHACRARSTRTHHACAPHQPCTCSHAATRAHVKSLAAAVLESLATG